MPTLLLHIVSESTLVNEVVRRLRNCYVGIPEVETKKILEKFTRKMKRSGYCEKMRREVLDAGVKIHEEQMEKERRGERAMYRTRKETKEEKRKEGGDKKKNWYKRRNKKGKERKKEERVVTVIMVPYTPKSELMRRMKKVAKKNSMNILFVEKGGHSLVNILGEADPFREEKCGRDACLPCKGQKRNSRCDVRGGAYEISCMEEGCREKGIKYFGECARVPFLRGKEHWKGYQRVDRENS